MYYEQTLQNISKINNFGINIPNTYNTLLNDFFNNKYKNLRISSPIKTTFTLIKVLNLLNIQNYDNNKFILATHQSTKSIVYLTFVTFTSLINNIIPDLVKNSLLIIQMDVAELNLEQIQFLNKINAQKYKVLFVHHSKHHKIFENYLYSCNVIIDTLVNFNDLSPHSQKNLLKKSFILLNNNTSISFIALFDKIDSDEFTWIFNNIMQRNNNNYYLEASYNLQNTMFIVDVSTIIAYLSLYKNKYLELLLFFQKLFIQ